jgi:tetratricopeptide (TPR) repeat protein
LLAAEAQPASTRRSERRRLGTVAQLRLPDETGTRRPRWATSPAGQGLAFTVAAVVLGGCFLAPVLNALAQRAIGRGEMAVSLMSEAYGKGNTVFAAQQREVARRSFQAAADYDPWWAQARERASVSMPDEQASVQELQTAIRLEPRNFQPYLSLGSFYEARQNWGAAVQAYRESVARYPENTRVLRLLAAAYRKVGDQTEALRTYQRLLAVKDSPSAKYVAISIDTDTNPAYAYYELGGGARRVHARWADGAPARRALPVRRGATAMRATSAGD